MWSISKIFLSLFSVFLLSFLVFFSFFSGTQDSPEQLLIDTFSVWKFEITKEKDIPKENKMSKDDTFWDEKVYLERINFLTEIFFTWNSVYEYSLTNDKIIFNLTWSWNYLLNLKDPTLNYIIEWEGFTLFPKGIWRIIIWFNGTDQVSIFSIDNVVEWTLRSLNTQETLTTKITLYPHQYLVYNPLKYNSIKNADHVRIKQVFDFSYIDAPLYNKERMFAKILFDKLPNLQVEAFKMISMYLYLREDRFKEKIVSQKNQALFYNIPWIAFIEKYRNFFLNDSKKALYYKNLIYADLVKLLDADKKDSPMLILKIDASLEELKKLSQKDYIEIKEVIESNIKMLSEIHDFELLDAKSHYFSLLWKSIVRKQLMYKNISFLRANTLYWLFDRGETKKFYGEIVSFVESFFENLKLNLEEQLILEAIWKDSNIKLQLDYFALFLENILVSNLGWQEEDLWDITKIMEKYVFLNSVLYGQGDETRRVTWVYVNLELLKSVARYLQDTYFQKERENTILKRKNNKNINIVFIRALEDNFQKVKDFYEQNKKFLSETNTRNLVLIKDYEKVFLDYEEYFLALTDTDKYEYEYDPANQFFRNSQINKNKDDFTLSEEKAKSYLSSFNWVIVEWSKIVVESGFYDISNISVWNVKMSFKIYPNNDNELTDIYINEKYRPESYKLDAIAKDWALRFSQWSIKNKEEFDFRNFFIQKFDPKQISDTPVVIQDTQKEPICPEEDKFVTWYKTRMLDKTEGAFTDLYKFLSITYKNFCVEQQGDNLRHYFLGPLFTMSIKTWKNEYPFYAKFYGDYKLTNSNFDFESISLKVYKDYVRDNKKFAFEGVPLNIKGTVPSLWFEDTFTQVFSDYEVFYSTVALLQARVWEVKNVELNYFLALKRYVIKFDFNGKKATISIASWKIASFVFDWKNIWANLSPTQMTEKLNTLK